MKILSISVACYNIEKFLRKNLDSFVTSPVKDKIEVLVTDDGSKDSSPDIVREYEDKYPGVVRLIQQQNAGPGSTVNSGIRHATGKYFKMVDGDDWVRTENLEGFIEFLENTDADMVFTNFEYFDDSENEISGREDVVNMEHGKVISINDIPKVTNTRMHSITYKTEILQANGITVDNGFYTDSQYMLFPVPFIKTAVFFDTDIYVYRIAQAGQSVSVQSMQKNVGAHRKIVEHIVNYYEDYRHDMTGASREYYSYNAGLVAQNQFETQLTFNINKHRISVIKEYVSWLHDASRDIYRDFAAAKKCRLVIGSGYMLTKLASYLYKRKLK